MRRLVALALPTLLALAPLAHAQAAPDLPDWDHLTPAQREALVGPLRERWNADPRARQRMWTHAERWRSMTPEQRAQARRGMDRFRDMSPAEREQARGAFDALRRMSPSERATWRKRLRDMTPEQRREWLRQWGGASPAGDAESRLRADRARADEAARSH